MISLYPIRTGILVRGKTAYFGCGLFPKNAAAWYCSLDIRTGKIIDRKPLQKSLQGYLVNRDGRIFAPTGRDPSGAFLETIEKRRQTKGKPSSIASISIPKQYPYAFATTATQGVGGGDGPHRRRTAHAGAYCPGAFGPRLPVRPRPDDAGRPPLSSPGGRASGARARRGLRLLNLEWEMPRSYNDTIRCCRPLSQGAFPCPEPKSR